MDDGLTNARVVITAAFGEITIRKEGDGRVPGVALTSTTGALMRQVRADLPGELHKRAAQGWIEVHYLGQSFCSHAEGPCPGSAIDSAITSVMRDVKKEFPRRKHLRSSGAVPSWEQFRS